MTPAIDRSREETAIQRVLETALNAWNQHDFRGLATVYAEDADIINPFGRVARSRSEIEAAFREDHAGLLKNSHLSVTPERTRFIADNVAIHDVAFDVTGVRDPAGREVPTIRGHNTIILKKSGDAWQVVAARPMIPAQPPGTK